jgi:hypothetical protein
VTEAQRSCLQKVGISSVITTVATALDRVARELRLDEA